MTASEVPNSSPDLLPTRSPSDRRLLLGSVLAFGLSFVVWRLETPALWETLRDFGREHAQLHVLWRAASDLARGPSLIVCIGLAFLMLGDAARRQLVVTSVSIGGLLSTLLKLIAHRARPVEGEGEWSWPSGHTAAAITFALALTLASRRPRTWRCTVWSVCGLIAVSRVMLQRHWPSDVLGGIGCALAAIPLARRVPLVVQGPAVRARTLLFAASLGLVAVMLGGVLDPHGLPIPRSWAILGCTVAASLAMHRASRDDIGPGLA